MKLLQKEGGEWHLSYEDGHKNEWTIRLQTVEKSVAEQIAETIGAVVAKFHNAAVPSVQKLFSDWLAEKEVEVAIATLQFYRQTVNEFIGYLGARSTNEVSEVSRKDVVDYRSKLAQQRLTPKTINHRIKTLRSIFGFALRERYITENPASFVKSIRNNAPRGTLSNQFADILALAGLRRKAPHHIPNGAGRHGGRQRFELSFHSLRHTSVTLLKEAGVPQAVVQELIGHDSPEISQHYTHVGLEALKKACAALPEI